MKVDTKIVLSWDDMFQAFKEFVSNHVDGVKAEDVCSFRLDYDMDNYTKSTVSVQLGYQEAKVCETEGSRS